MVRYLLGLAMLLGTASCLRSQMPVTTSHASPASLNKNTGELFQESMYWSNYFWDDQVKLIKSPYQATGELVTGKYMVRESSWYALGLLFRDQPGDRERAASIIDAVLKQQYTTPGSKWYGTYKRTPEEPIPSGDSSMWKGYDPNWRVFIGTTFAMILMEYPERVPAELQQRMYTAIDLSIDGEMKEGRLVPSYSNIALMYGFLWDYAAQHDHRADWQKKSADWNETVYSQFKQYGEFPEYNSPTYSGVDIYGLALWRNYGSNEHMRSIGSEMETKLWNDLANYYQPALRNLSGPFDRAYGMDMEHYVSVVGVWMGTVLDASIAPLPTLTATTDHLPDIWFAPHFAILGTKIPEAALRRMKQFPGGHLVQQRISSDRVATAWIGERVIYGGESTHKTKDAGATSQFHPGTIQWRTPSGEIGWVQLIECPPVDVRADEHGLKISTRGTVRLRIHAKGLARNNVTPSLWQLPGLQVEASSDKKDFTVKDAPDSIDLVYSDISHMRLDIKALE